MAGAGMSTARWALRRIRRRFRRLRLYVAVFTGTLLAVAGTMYGEVSGSARTALLIMIATSTGIFILLSDHQLPADGDRAPQPGQLYRMAVLPAAAVIEGNRTGRRRRRQRRRRRRAGSSVSTIPPSDGSFRGRQRELRELQQRHDRQRAARRRGKRGPVPAPWSETVPVGPVIILIHGQAGVGKSALAEELGRRLAGSYPDGHIFTNLGTAGAARTPNEILRDFLLALGWSETEMPKSTVERARIFRSLTRYKRMMFVLDAARHADQVRHVLPNDTEALVIVTSRPDLSAAPELNLADQSSYLLTPPEDAEALAIFRSISATDHHERPECAAEIVDMCDRLPAAIRSAAERVSLDGTDICGVSGLLHQPESRLRWLDRPGRPVLGLIEADYDRLLPEERRAFAVLALVPSRSFVPWVLSPLLDVPSTQAEALVDRLSAVMLIDGLGRDPCSGLARYRFHGVVRLYAELKARELGAEFATEALRRLDEANTAVVATVMAELDDSYPRPSANRWLGADSEVPRQIATDAGQWVRAEHPSLLRVLQYAARHGDDGLCWRIGVWLDGCVPSEGGLRAAEQAYDLALEAAGRERNELGVIDVMLAKCAFLAGTEQYATAITGLVEAASSAQAAQPEHGPAAIAREAGAHRRIAEAYHRAGSYGRAMAALEAATRLAITARATGELELIRLLTAVVHRVDSPDTHVDQLLGRPLNVTKRYWGLIGLAEAARRRCDWRSAAGHLAEAAEVAAGDLHREADVHYRTASVQLERSRAEGTATNRTNRPLAESAVRHASIAAVSFHRMENGAGVVRARCLIARSLIGTGHPVEAEQMLRFAERRLANLDRVEDPVASSLTARLTRARGELLLSTGRVDAARQLLADAAAIFGGHQDWFNQSAVIDSLESITRVTD